MGKYLVTALVLLMVLAGCQGMTEADVWRIVEEAAVVGPLGPTGPTGPAGEKGDKGLQGDKGLRGAAGEKGPIGPQGDRGPAGEKGVKGPTGPAGAKGDKGLRGAPGLPGPRGPQGDRGRAGSPAPTVPRITTAPPPQAPPPTADLKTTKLAALWVYISNEGTLREVYVDPAFDVPRFGLKLFIDGKRYCNSEAIFADEGEREMGCESSRASHQQVKTVSAQAPLGRLRCARNFQSSKTQSVFACTWR